MSSDFPGIREIDLSAVDAVQYTHRLADCIVLTKDGELCLQQKPEYWDRFPGYLMAFGGHVEKGESVMDGLCREIEEELGARIDPDDAVFIGAVSEDFSGHSDILHLYFWHDKNGLITGCYEGEVRFYKSVNDVWAHPKIMDYLRWGLTKAQDMGLVTI